jgi:DNA-binding transcriptional MerR regulator
MSRTKTRAALNTAHSPTASATTDLDSELTPRHPLGPHPLGPESTGIDGHFFTIGELADEFDITTRTIRFYEARGLLVPARFRSNRAYSRRDRARLKLILRGKNLGFSLEDIAEYLSLYDSDPGQVTQTKLLLGKIEAHIADLNGKRTDIERTLNELREIRAQCQGHLRRDK